MTPEALYRHLDYADKSRENRKKAAGFMLRHPELMPDLLRLCYRFDDPLSCKACMTLEFICKQQLHRLLPFLDEFIANLSRFTFDAAVRPAAHIARMLTVAYFGKNPSPVKDRLTETHRKQLAGVYFDWLMSNRKVAVKAYAIYSLYELGKEQSWIYPELKTILEQNMHRHSAAYKAAARNTLTKLRL